MSHTMKLPSERRRHQQRPGYRELFTHEDGKAVNVFDISEMRRKIEENREHYDLTYRCVTELKHICSFIRQNREIDRARVMEILIFEEKSFNDPGIVILMPDGTQLIIDGHHRALAREAMGEADWQFYLIALGDADMWDDAARERAEAEGGPLIELPWGEYDVVPGKGLVKRSKST